MEHAWMKSNYINMNAYNINFLLTHAAVGNMNASLSDTC
jgi:hypothetical protein